MIPINEFVVEPNKLMRYDNVEKIGDVDFITSASLEDHKVSNRVANVLEVPLRYEGPVKKGYKLIVHHNVFKYYNDMRGKRKSGKSYFFGDKFLIDDEQWYMYHDGNSWHAREGSCFVEPIKLLTGSRLPLHGVMRYPDSYLKSKGVVDGVEVIFEPESEYEFNIDGTILYRMTSQSVVAYGK